MLFGTDIHALIHAVEEEFLIQAVVNAFAHQETGTEPPVFYAQILKPGVAPD